MLGPGGIAADFTDALHKHTTPARRRGRVAVGRARRRVRGGARRGASHGSYEALVADPEVDVVYVATPHSEHREHALLAIAAGKHVLIEKPMAVTAEQARTIVAAARAAGVFAMEAMWTRYLPQTDIVRQLLEDGALGEVRVVTADFGGARPSTRRAGSSTRAGRRRAARPRRLRRVLGLLRARRARRGSSRPARSPRPAWTSRPRSCCRPPAARRRC